MAKIKMVWELAILAGLEEPRKKIFKDFLEEYGKSLLDKSSKNYGTNLCDIFVYWKKGEKYSPPFFLTEEDMRYVLWKQFENDFFKDFFKEISGNLEDYIKKNELVDFLISQYEKREFEEAILFLGARKLKKDDDEEDEEKE